MTVRLTPGDPAPEFELADAQGSLWNLSRLVGKRVVLYFYPADDTPGCTAESCDFRDNYDRFKDANTEVLGVSPQGAASHERFAKKYSLNFPLLIDEDLKTAEAYGAVADKPGDLEGTPLKVTRSTFVISEEGTIEQAIYGVRVKGHAESLLQTLS